MGRHLGKGLSRLFQHNPSFYFGMSLSVRSRFLFYVKPDSFIPVGQDSKSRLTLISLLHSVHISNSLYVIMGLRLQDPVPGGSLTSLWFRAGI
jgi:hypothetical protein